MNNHVDQVPEMFAEDEVSVSDYVENPDDAQDIAIQLCSMLSAAGTSVNENGDFVMDAAQLKAFAALLRRNRFLAGKKVRKYYKRRSRRVLDQIPEDDIETSLTSANRGERDKFGLGSTLRGKVVAIENKLPLSELPPSPAAADEDGAERTLEVGEVVLTLSPDGKSYLPGEIFDPEAAPPIVRVLKPEEEGQHSLVAVYPHGGFGWFTDSHVWRTDAAQLKRLEIVSTDSVAKEAFRIAQDPAKWRTTFNASLKVMVEARRATDIEHDDKAKAKDDSMAPDDKDATVADGDEEGSNIDDHDNYEDLQPSRHLRSHAHLLGPDRYEVGELVLGKLQGHPPWPGKIADPHKLPMQIALACPDRDDPDVYPIRFYPDGDYWWVKHTEIIRLDQERVAKFVRETRANFGPLLEGYKIARDTSEWEANNPTPEDVVDLYMIEMPEKPKPKVVEQKMSHKRKRGHHRDDSGTPQPNKRRKRGEDGEEHKPRKRKMQSMSQDYVNGDVKNESMESSVVDQRPPLSPRAAAAEQAQERKNKLLKMRWLLQKTFLSGEKPNDMKFPDASRVIDELQKDTEITGAVLRETKLQKVLMGITKMDFIRNDDEFDFRGRARALLKQWEHIPMPPSSNAGDGLGERGGSAKPSLSGLDLGLSPLVINTQLPKAGSVLGSAASQRASVPRGMSTPSALLTALPSAADDTPTQDHA